MFWCLKTLCHNPYNNDQSAESEQIKILVQWSETLVFDRISFTWLVGHSSPFDVTELGVGDVWCIRMWRFSETFLSALYEHWLQAYCLPILILLHVVSVPLPSSFDDGFDALFSSASFLFSWVREIICLVKKFECRKCVPVRAVISLMSF